VKSFGVRRLTSERAQALGRLLRFEVIVFDAHLGAGRAGARARAADALRCARESAGAAVVLLAGRKLGACALPPEIPERLFAALARGAGGPVRAPPPPPLVPSGHVASLTPY